jgi:ATP-dependent Clp protease ATP-binding subunit ClpB
MKSNDIACVVAKATGISVQNLLKGRSCMLVNFCFGKRERTNLQLFRCRQRVSISRAGLQTPNRPVASFLFLGQPAVRLRHFSCPVSGP